MFEVVCEFEWTSTSWHNKMSLIQIKVFFIQYELSICYVWRRCGVVPFESASPKRGLRAHHARWDYLQETNTNLLLLQSGGRSLERTIVMRPIQGEESCGSHHHQSNGGKSLKWLLQHRRRRRTLGTGALCPSGSNHWGLLLFRLPITNVVYISIDKLMYKH